MSGRIAVGLFRISSSTPRVLERPHKIWSSSHFTAKMQKCFAIEEMIALFSCTVTLSALVAMPNSYRKSNSSRSNRERNSSVVEASAS